MGYMASSALHLAITLNVPDQLAGGPKDVAELARASGANEDALYRILRLLSSTGIFAEQGPRRFALTQAADLLRKGVPGSIRDMAVFLPDPFHFKVYAELNSRDEWRRLPYSERGLLVTIWIEYRRSGGQLRAMDIGLRGGQRVRLRSLQSLNDAGFIQLSASKPLALRARERRSREREERT